MENKWLCDSCLKRTCIIQITHNANTPIDDCRFYLEKKQEPTTKNDLGVDCIKKSDAINIIQDMHGLARADVISDAVNRIITMPSVTPQEPKTEKVIKMRDVTPEERESLDKYIKSISNPTGVDFWNLEQEPKIGHCKDCKWWKDSDGEYRRGCRAESQCPINRKEVYEGNGYCYMYEPQESEKI